MSTKEYKQIIIEKLNACLKPLGFKREGNSYQLSNGDLTYYIILQSSMTSTSQLLKITVNIEIASAKLAMFDDDRMSMHLHRHYSKRIGRYLDEPHDKWFLINSTETALFASDQIVRLIITKVIPEFELLKSTDDLISNPSGLTEMQRKRYLNLLDKLKSC
jgi:Domain of unknown function (DUF4304)